MFFRLVLLSMIASLPALGQAANSNLRYQSSQNQLVSVFKGKIIVNGQPAFEFPQDNIVYKSKRNGLQEDKGKVYLFLETTNGTLKNRLNVFSIVYSKADSLFSVVASDVKDYDRDGYLEFGGSELATPHPSADSLYYLPSAFFEIKKGAIAFDAEYTQKIDTKVNGTYLVDPLDRSGKCCVALPKKKK
ncbi:hypothetical protein [uncultured Chitinophaga sp.]|uniref:hypothetical protein n=1 Tax=uncultured Chitinophaga sp. TaxID=339340 RepID=UPI0025CDD379|nr:hypothetical protein [uncultured Chitinophaga sp.]